MRIVIPIQSSLSIRQFSRCDWSSDQLINKSSDNQAAYNMRGIAKLELGQAEKAISDFDLSVMLDSGDYRAFYNRWQCLLPIGEVSASIHDYDLALKLEPKSPDLYINRGNALVQLQRLEEAINEYSFALKIDNSIYLTHFNLGRTYFLMDSLDLAKESFQHTVDIYASYAPAYYFLVMISWIRMRMKHLVCYSPKQLTLAINKLWKF